MEKSTIKALVFYSSFMYLPSSLECVLDSASFTAPISASAQCLRFIGSICIMV